LYEKFYVDLAGFVLRSAVCLSKAVVALKASLAFVLFQLSRLGHVYFAFFIDSQSKLRRLPFISIWQTRSWSKLSIPTKV